METDKLETKAVKPTRRRRRAGPLAAAGAMLATGAGMTIASAAPAFAAGGTAGEIADPDTVFAPNAEYMYGTSYTGPNCSGTVTSFMVPLVIATPGTGSGSTFDGVCTARESFAAPANWWGDPGGGIWAPSVVNFNGQWHMYYTALVRGTGQRCIGHALSNAFGVFIPNDGNKWACPSNGRWVIDPDAKVIDGRIVVAYRDDAVTTGNQTGISIVGTDANGFADWNTRRTALTSDAVGDWAWNAPHSTKVIENPSLVPRGDGTWDLFFSAGEWNGPNYGTGAAHCGSALQAGGCKMMGSTSSPYFGYSGNAYGTQYTLPENHAGPGGMDAYQGTNGYRVAWHWWKADGVRYSRTSNLLWNGTNWKVGY